MYTQPYVHKYSKSIYVSVHLANTTIFSFSNHFIQIRITVDLDAILGSQ